MTWNKPVGLPRRDVGRGGRVRLLSTSTWPRGGLSLPPSFDGLLQDWRLLQVEGWAIANQFAQQFNSFAEQRDPSNIVSITIRPPLNLAGNEGAPLLDDAGHAPIHNYRAVHKAASDLVQRALEYLAAQKVMESLLVVRHPRLLGDGSFADFHVHVTGVLNPTKEAALQKYMTEKFGASQIWISPEKDRIFVTTANYPVRQLGKIDFSTISQENLAEFYRQSRGLRFVDTAGDLRAFQNGLKPGRRRSAPKARVAAQAATTATQIPARDATATNNEPKLRGIGLVWLGGVLRLMARVVHYRTFADLEARYDLAADILRAEAYSAEATVILLNAAANPENGFHSATKYNGKRSVAKTTKVIGQEPVDITPDAVVGTQAGADAVGQEPVDITPDAVVGTQVGADAVGQEPVDITPDAVVGTQVGADAVGQEPVDITPDAVVGTQAGADVASARPRRRKVAASTPEKPSSHQEPTFNLKLALVLAQSTDCSTTANVSISIPRAMMSACSLDIAVAEQPDCRK
jgi:hypothetical protein